jgi:cleavage and polyadenylation specificity factor subunit 1
MLRTEYHMGTPVTTCKTVARRRAPEEEFAPQTQLIYGTSLFRCCPLIAIEADAAATADGALTTVVSVKPARFKRLQLVAEQLTRNARHVAGMNPKAYR